MPEYTGDFLLIQDFIRLGETICMPSEYDIFRLTPDPFASVKVERLKQQGYEDQPDIRSLNREQFNTFGYCPDPLNKKLYFSGPCTLFGR